MKLATKVLESLNKLNINEAKPISDSEEFNKLFDNLKLDYVDRKWSVQDEAGKQFIKVVELLPNYKDILKTVKRRYPYAGSTGGPSPDFRAKIRFLQNNNLV